MKKKTKKHKIAQTMAQAARLLSVELSVIKLAKRSGCDAFQRSGRVDLVSLGKWLALHPSGAQGTPSAANLPPPEPVDLSDIESSLTAAISVEESNLRMLRAAQARGDAIAVAALNDAYAKSQKNRLTTEGVVLKLRLERGQLVTVFEHQRLVNTIWPPLINQLRALPRSIAPRLAGLEADKIDETLTVAIESALAETKKSLAENTAVDHHLDVWIDGELEADPSGARMRQKIDQLLVDLPKIIEVTAAINKRRNPEKK